LEDRLRDLERFVGRVRPAPAQRVGERFPLDERHHVVDEALGVAREVDRQDRGVLQARQRLRLLAEPDEHPGGPGDLGVQHFAGEAAVEVLVPQLVHLGEPSAPHEPLHLILGAERAGETLPGRPHLLTAAPFRRPHPLTPLPSGEGEPGGGAVTLSFVITVGDGLPHAGQNAEPVGISARHAGQVRPVTARKIRGPGARCNGGAAWGRSMLRPYIILTDAHPPHRPRSRPRLRGARRPRVAVSGAACVPGSPPDGAGPAARPEVDPHRIFVYGRSLGSAAATYTATRHPVAGLILESPFTTAAEMARDAYRILPRFILRLSLDNLGRIKQVRCPVLLFHGTDDRLVPVRMGMQVAAAAPGPVEVVLIQASGHNDTYDA